MRHRVLTPLALCTILGVAALAGSAGALDAEKPVPCDVVLITDPTGDQVFIPNGHAGPLEGDPKPGTPNTDIKRVWTNFKPDKDGEEVLTANIEIANMDKTIPPKTESQGGLVYYFSWIFDDIRHFAYAQNLNGSGYTYGYARYVEGGYVDNPAVGVTGQVFEGADGVIQFDIPASVGGAVGETLTEVMVFADGITGGPNHESGFNNHIDQVPDGQDVNAEGTLSDPVEKCPDGPTATATATASATASATATATPRPGSPPPGSPPPGSRPPGTTPSGPALTSLPVSFAKSIGKARKARKGKSLSFAAKATKPISRLTLSLKNRAGKGRALASGRVASLPAGTRKVKLRLKKALKKGTYTLQATGTVDGKKLSKSQKVKVK